MLTPRVAETQRHGARVNRPAPISQAARVLASLAAGIGEEHKRNGHGRE